MNRLILALIISCGLTACSNNGTKKSASIDVEQTQPQEQKDRVEVLYFHSKQRCATCMAIEKNAKEAVEAEFEKRNTRFQNYRHFRTEERSYRREI